MQFKVTIVTGMFLLIINSLSIANPISKNEIPPQKTEQTHQKKPNFIQKTILKKIQKKVAKKNKIKHEQPSKLAITSVVLGVASYFFGILAGTLIFPEGLAVLLLFAGIALAIAAIITGGIAPRKKDNKSYTLAKLGTWLGIAHLLILLFGFLYAMASFSGW